MLCRSWLLAAALLPPVLCGQPARTLYIPALAYGPNIWSIVRLTNSNTAPESVRVEAYREDGAQLPIGPAFEVQPDASLDVRIGAGAPADEVCWARVTVPPGVDARGIVEILKDNTLEEFTRQAHGLSDRAQWVTLTSAVEGKFLYFLNGATRPTVVSFCAVNQAQPGTCGKKGSASVQYRVDPNQSLGLQVRKPRQKFFVTESSTPEGAVLVLFDAGPGDKKFFGSKSTIEFGDPRP